MCQETYNLWSVVLQIVIALAMFFTFWVYYRQWLTMKLAAKGQNMLAVNNLLQASDVRAARKHVQTVLRNKDFILWTDADRDEASKVVTTYCVASILVVQQKLFDVSFIANWRISIKDCYAILVPYIEDMQNQKGDPTYWKDYKLLNDSV